MSHATTFKFFFKNKVWLSLIAAVVLILTIFSPWFKNVYLSFKTACYNCNIILIDVDILRADELPCYGYSRNTTPNICAFGKKSQIFYNNFSQSHWTLPSIFSVITSLYPGYHRMFHSFGDTLNPQIPTLAQVLNKSGYRTFYIGQSFNATLTKINGGLKGYDVVESKIDQISINSKLQDSIKNKHPLFLHFYIGSLHMPYYLENEGQQIAPMERPEGFPLTRSEFFPYLQDYLIDNYITVFTDKAITEHPDIFGNPGLDRGKKIVNFFVKMTEETIPNANYVKESWWDSVYKVYTQIIRKNGQAGTAYARLLYDSNIALVDKRLKPILDLINNKDYSENTIVVIYSDHGEEFAEHGEYGHNVNLHNEILRVPLIVYVPQKKPKAYYNISQSLDIFPTILNLVGINNVYKLQGQPLFAVGNKIPTHEYAIGQISDYDLSIRNALWNLIIKNYRLPQQKTALYNLKNDLLEQTDVSLKNPQIVHSLMTQVAHILR